MGFRPVLLLLGLLQFAYVVWQKPGWISPEMSFLILNLYVMASCIAGRRRPWWAGMAQRKWGEGRMGWGGPWMRGMHGGPGCGCGGGPCSCGDCPRCRSDDRDRSGGHHHGHGHDDEPLEGQT